MPARDTTYSTLNYAQRGGSVWHVNGTLELGDTVVVSGATAGQVVVTGLPTADPHVVGALWANAAVLTVSAG